MKKNRTRPFLEIAVKYTGNDCLIWPFARHKVTHGYGSLNINKKHVYAHRWVCQAVHGIPPSEKHQAAHSCGNGPGGCVNPRHLRWATDRENKLDEFKLGRRGPGSKSTNVKLTEAEVIFIRKALVAGVTQQHLADKYSVSRSLVGRIKQRLIWTHI